MDEANCAFSLEIIILNNVIEKCELPTLVCLLAPLLLL